MEPLSGDDPAEIGGYKLRARLGAGGMGRVYLASTPGGRRVALKVVRPELGDDPDFRTRFRQEIAAAQRVRGLYTAELLNADPDASPPWLVTAYVPGPSLQRAVTDHGPMPAETVIRLVAGVAEALQAIHAAGVVHRDLKPSNVLLAPDGPRVIDFGIARAAESTSVTGSNIRVGSPQYMAPEQIRGTPATPALDVFALGSLTAFALLGRVPFGEGNPAALMHRVLNLPPDLTGCSGPMRDLIASCLAKDPAVRPDPGQIIDTCRTLSEGHLGDFTESWWPTLAGQAGAGQAGTMAESGPPSPAPGSPAGSPPPAGSPSPAPGSPAPPGSGGARSPRPADAGLVPPEWARPQTGSQSGKGQRAASRRGPATPGSVGAPGSLGARGLPGSRTAPGSSGPQSAPAAQGSGSPNGPRTPPNTRTPPGTRAPSAPGVPSNPRISGATSGTRAPSTSAPTTGPRARNGAPTGPRTYGGPGRLPIPATVFSASKFMYAGAGVAIVGLIAGLATLHELRVLIEQDNPNASQSYVSSSLGTAAVTLVILGGAGTLLWLWMARVTRRGERRARTLSTLLFALATVVAINLTTRGETTALSGAFAALEWVIGLISIILLWSTPSRRYYDSVRPQGPTVPRSPSLRERAEYQRNHPTDRDYPAQRR
jgi:serine/threonine protein kinase